MSAIDLVEAELLDAGEPITLPAILDSILDESITMRDVEAAVDELIAERAAAWVDQPNGVRALRLTTREERESTREQTGQQEAAVQANPKRGLQQQVIDWITTNGPATTAMIREALGLTRKQAENAIGNARRAGRLVQDSHGLVGETAPTWTLPADAPPRPVQRQPDPPAPVAKAEPQKSRWALWSDGTIEIQTACGQRVTLAADEVLKIADASRSVMEVA